MNYISIYKKKDYREGRIQGRKSNGNTGQDRPGGSLLVEPGALLSTVDESL